MNNEVDIVTLRTDIKVVIIVITIMTVVLNVAVLTFSKKLQFSQNFPP